MNCIIIDDEPMADDILKEYINKVSFLKHIRSFRNPVEALTFLNKISYIDLVFLDINMPDLNGIDLINSLSYKPEIILTTAYSDYALQSYEMDVTDYLLKPIEFNRFLKAVNKASKNFRKEDKLITQPEYVFLKSGKEIIKFDQFKIKYIKGFGNYLSVRYGNDKILVLMTFQQIMQKISDQLFVQIHKSYIVSLKHVEAISKSHVNVAGEMLPIGGYYRKGFLQKIEKI